MTQAPLTSLPAWDQGWLPARDGHRLYYEQWGRQDGPVALVLHGGPGSGFSERLRSFFDPEQFRVIAFDQRGCGRSTPRGECRHNTTAHLLADMERLRHALGVAQWLLVGGSWGATLGLAYATRHRAQVTGLLLRGFFWPEASHIDAFFAGRPWRQWASQLESASVSERHAAARAWWQWESSRSAPASASAQDAGQGLPEPSEAQLDALCDRCRVQAWYLQHECWLNEASLGRDAPELSDLPIQFLHGREDQVCSLSHAQRVQAWLAGSGWLTVEGAGHDPFHPAMAQAMRAALDRFARTGRFSQYPAASARR
ncbi:MAG: alpha/beta fold hydrolase [Gallionella sp.]|nr:alpha/beta fold hydrolase [Gallionella sp.]